MNKLLNQKTLLSLALIVIIGAMIAPGCGGNGGSTDIINNMTSGLPGLGRSGRREPTPQEMLSLGAKGLDVMDVNSPQRQDEIGQSVAVAISNRYQLSNDQALNEYVNLVGLTVASVSPRSDINYAFGVLDTPSVGAYSAPGGYIFITTGALRLIQDEAELAGVLAHEVAHVAMDHGIEAVKAAKGADFVVSAAKTYDQNVRAYGRNVDVVVDTVLVKGYSRDQESRADTEAVKYLAAAGYDPNGLVRFLQNLQRQPNSGGGQLMSTHPGTAQRVADAQRQVAQTRATGVTLRDRYAANVRIR